MITEERYNTHDCKLGPEDSCSTCEEWFKQQNTPNKLLKWMATDWKQELGKRSNIRIYNERGLSNQDFLGQW